MNAMSGFRVLSPGLLTTVQDRGRLHYIQDGVAVCGAMDPFAHHFANFLVCNAEDAPVLECTLLGPTLELLRDTVLAVTGGDLSPTLNGEPLPLWQSVHAPKGSMISFGGARRGARCFIAFAGGIDVPPVMGSHSTDLRSRIGGWRGRALKSGDVIPLAAPPATPILRSLPEKHHPRYTGDTALRVVLGPQDDHFTGEGIETFLGSQYQVSSECNRQGYRLEGAPIAHKNGADILSDGIVMGSVQIPGNGLPIILMADRQTAGGYPKIATVISPDLPLVAQAKAGDHFRFRAVGVEEAQQLLRRERQREEWLKAQCISRQSPAQPSPAPRSMTVTVNGQPFHVTVREQS